VYEQQCPRPDPTPPYRPRVQRGLVLSSRAWLRGARGSAHQTCRRSGAPQRLVADVRRRTNLRRPERRAVRRVCAVGHLDIGRLQAAVQTTLPSAIQIFIVIDDSRRLRESFHKTRIVLLCTILTRVGLAHMLVVMSRVATGRVVSSEEVRVGVVARTVVG